MRDDLKATVAEYYSRKHQSVINDSFEYCWPAQKPAKSGFRFGFIVGCLASGTAFATLLTFTSLMSESDIKPDEEARNQQQIVTTEIRDDAQSTVMPEALPEVLSESPVDSGIAVSIEPVSTSSGNFNPDNRVPSQSRLSARPEAEPELSQRVLTILEEVQLRQLDDQWEAALNEMNALYTEYEQLNSLEQTMLLNFYTNTLIRLQMWNEAILAFTRMTDIPNLRPDLNARALLSLGQLNDRIGDTQASIFYLESWLQSIEGLDVTEEQIAGAQEMLEAARQKLGN